MAQGLQGGNSQGEEAQNQDGDNNDQQRSESLERLLRKLTEANETARQILATQRQINREAKQVLGTARRIQRGVRQVQSNYEVMMVMMRNEPLWAQNKRHGDLELAATARQAPTKGNYALGGMHGQLCVLTTKHL
jgi:hypothetical protein